METKAMTPVASPIRGGLSLFPHPSMSDPKPLPASIPYRVGTPVPQPRTASSLEHTTPLSRTASGRSVPYNGRTTPQTVLQSQSGSPAPPPRTPTPHRRHPSSVEMLRRAASYSMNNPNLSNFHSNGGRQSPKQSSPQQGPRHDLAHPEFVASGSVSPVTPRRTPSQAKKMGDAPSVLVQGPLLTGSPPPAHSTSTAVAGADRDLARSSIDMSSTAAEKNGAVIRSIFPQFNPQLPLDQQEYYPTQWSTSNVPQQVVNRQAYSAQVLDPGPLSPPMRSACHCRHHNHHHTHHSTNSRGHTYLSNGSASGPTSPVLVAPPACGGDGPTWFDRVFTPMPDPPIGSSTDLQDLWRVCNGWTTSGGGPGAPTSVALRLTVERDAPIFHLTAANGQPFYFMKIDPRATTAYVTLSRFDPYKAAKASSSMSYNKFRRAATNPMDSASAPPSTSSPIPPPTASSPGPNSQRGWVEVLTTTVEPKERRQPPYDGLVALLCPLKVIKMASAATITAATASNPSATSSSAARAAAVATAALERETARLVWDDDTKCDYLVYPTLATPFRVTVERQSARCRTEYVLEHVESARPLARLVRDGDGGGDGGFLDVDLAVVSMLFTPHALLSSPPPHSPISPVSPGSATSFWEARVLAAADAPRFIVDTAVAALLLVAAEDARDRKIEAFSPPPTSAIATGAIEAAFSPSATAAASGSVPPRVPTRCSSLRRSLTPGSFSGRYSGGGVGRTVNDTMTENDGQHQNQIHQALKAPPPTHRFDLVDGESQQQSRCSRSSGSLSSLGKSWFGKGKSRNRVKVVNEAELVDTKKRSWWQRIVCSGEKSGEKSGEMKSKKKKKKKKKKEKKKEKRRGKEGQDDEKDRLPFVVRIVMWILMALAWCFKMGFRTAAAAIEALTKCCGTGSGNRRG